MEWHADHDEVSRIDTVAGTVVQGMVHFGPVRYLAYQMSVDDPMRTDVGQLGMGDGISILVARALREPTVGFRADKYIGEDVRSEVSVCRYT